MPKEPTTKYHDMQIEDGKLVAGGLWWCSKHKDCRDCEDKKHCEDFTEMRQPDHD